MFFFETRFLARNTRLSPDALADYRRFMSPDEGVDACGLSGIHSPEATYENTQNLLGAIGKNEHRGGDSDKGADGVGILGEVTGDFRAQLLKEAKDQDHDSSIDVNTLSQKPGLGAGSVFFKEKNPETIRRQQNAINTLCQKHGVEIHQWRKVPVDDSIFDEKQKQQRPEIYQPLFTVPEEANADQAEILCGNLRTTINREFGNAGISVSSFSTETIVYKGMIRAQRFSQFYKHDLLTLRPKIKLGMIHVRFSTNTNPDWSRAQPFSYVAHNGEINTLNACRNAGSQLEKFRGNSLAKVAKDALREVGSLPYILSHMGSDSQDFNQTLHAFMEAGFELVEAMRILVPQAAPAIEREINSYLSYMERTTGGLGSWHGPAALIAIQRGEMVAMVDRMALRPMKWVLLKNGSLVVGSEIGAMNIHWKDVVDSGQLNPGEMMHMDKKGELSGTDKIMRHLIENIKQKGIDPSAISKVFIYQTKLKEEGKDHQEQLPKNVEKVFSQLISIGWNKEDVEALKKMMRDGAMPLEAMGYSYPLYMLSGKPHFRRLYDAFHQQFAQVTNPPIDSIREGSKMSLRTFVGGKRGDMRDALNPEAYENRYYTELASPVVDEGTFEGIRHNSQLDVHTIDVSCGEGESYASVLPRIQNEVLAKAKEGSVILLDDRNGFEEGNTSLPMARVALAVMETLNSKGLGKCVDVGVSATDVAEPHDAMALISMGIGFVYPRGVYELTKALHSLGGEKGIAVPKKPGQKKIPQAGDNAGETTVNFTTPGAEQYVSLEQALANLHKTFDGGMKKIMSKIGIPTISGYRDARRMSVLGIAAFTSMMDTPIGGITDEQIFQLINYQKEHSTGTEFPSLKEAEYDFNLAFQGIHDILDTEDDIGTIFEKYMEIAARVNGRIDPRKRKDKSAMHISMLSDLLEIDYPKEVKEGLEFDSVLNILRDSFSAGAMSHGALSEVAHEAIAMACNELGINSNSGEGGESLSRTEGSETKIRQLASGRFGVTDVYLGELGVTLQIKMAQGAKPGEGGQLAGAKVNEGIAKNRHCEPGTTLVSPPPHHDIYSIEDLSQLIYDLRQINPGANVEVKLAASAGIDVVACGVAKAGADVIVIDGFNGGTGATPRDSKNHAGIPWEIGVPSVHQALSAEGLRDRVELHIGGGIRTGEDAVKAEMLGADKVIMGTNLMIYQGCTKEDQCSGSENHCTASVAHEGALMNLKERDPAGYENQLTKRKKMIKNGLLCFGQEKSEIYKKLGVKNGKELRGRTDLLHRLVDSDGNIVAKHIDLKRITQEAEYNEQTYFPAQVQRQQVTDSLGQKLARDVLPTLSKDPAHISYRHRRVERLVNTDRTIGAGIAGEIVRSDLAGLIPDNSISLRFRGSAGQKFGFGLSKGVKMHHTGTCEDYVGEALSGGRIIIKQSFWDTVDPKAQYTIGGKCGFGATSGDLFTDGTAADRFGVRLSGATLVCDGCGEFGAEYMTGGTLVSLSPVGNNFGKAMTGGQAFIYKDSSLSSKLGTDATDGKIQPMSNTDQQYLKKTIARYANNKTGVGSRKANKILRNWKKEKNNFQMIAA